MENFSATELNRNIGEFPVFQSHINTIFELARLEKLRSIGMSYKGITKLEHGEGCHTIGISTCLGGLQYAHGVYSAFHSQGLTLPYDAFLKVSEGVLFTGHSDTWKEYVGSLLKSGNTFMFPPGFDFYTWSNNPWDSIFVISFAFLPEPQISNVTPGLYVAYTPG